MSDKFLCNNNNNGQGNAANPAYPTPANSHPYTLGLTKRELFAAMAMQGVISSPSYDSRYFQDNVQEAVAYADALLTALEESNHE